MRRVVIAGIVVGFALAGPRLSAPQDRRAGEAFVYVPPEGFVESNEGPNGGPLGSDETLWIHPPLPGHTTAPRLHLKRSRMGGTVEPADLAKLAEGMPELLRPMGVTWKDVRHETRTRTDGSRVGLIEGESVSKVPGLLPLAVADHPSAEEHQRRLLFLFPTDDGTALTTAVFDTVELATWEPLFEASIGTARGVAVRLPPPPQWMHFAWGGAGLVLALLGNALWKSGKAAGGTADSKGKVAEHARDDEDEEAA